MKLSRRPDKSSEAATAATASASSIAGDDTSGLEAFDGAAEQSNTVLDQLRRAKGKPLSATDVIVVAKQSGAFFIWSNSLPSGLILLAHSK